MSAEFSLWSENQSAEILHENAASDVVTSPGQADFEIGSKGDGLAWLAFIGCPGVQQLRSWTAKTWEQALTTHFLEALLGLAQL